MCGYRITKYCAVRVQFPNDFRRFGWGLAVRLSYVSLGNVMLNKEKHAIFLTYNEKNMRVGVN